MTNSAISSQFHQLAKLAANWLGRRHAVCADRHAVCANFHQLAGTSPVGNQLVELASAWQKRAGNWTNWIGNARYGCHRIIGRMTNWQPVLPVGGQLVELVELDGASGWPLAGKLPVGGVIDYRRAAGRRRGPWRFREVGGFIGDADLSPLTEQKNTPLQQHRVAHAL